MTCRWYHAWPQLMYFTTKQTLDHCRGPGQSVVVQVGHWLVSKLTVSAVLHSLGSVSEQIKAWDPTDLPRQFRVQELCESRGGRPGLSVLTSLLVSVDVNLYWTMLTHWPLLVPNRSTDIRGLEALLQSLFRQLVQTDQLQAQHVWFFRWRGETEWESPSFPSQPR